MPSYLHRKVENAIAFSMPENLMLSIALNYHSQAITPSLQGKLIKINKFSKAVAWQVIKRYRYWWFFLL